MFDLLTLAVSIAAKDAVGGRGENPDEGAGIAIIVGVILAVVLLVALVIFLSLRLQRRSRGGIG